MKTLLAIALLIPVLATAQTADHSKTETTNWTGFYAGLNAGGTVGTTKAITSTVYAADGYDSSESASDSVLKTGWIAGGGVDYALKQHWSARVEYLYADFGTVSNAGSVFAYANSTYPATVISHTATLTSNIARIAVNYRF